MSDGVRDAGYDDFVDALEEGVGYYLECPNGHGSLPPRRVCPHCGDTDLAETSLPKFGEVESFTEIHVPTPAFGDDAPYVVALVDFGPVTLTGQLRDVDEIETGLEVAPTVGETETGGERLLLFEPR